MDNRGMITEKHSNFFEKIDDEIERNKRDNRDDKKSHIFFNYIFIKQPQKKTSLL